MEFKSKYGLNRIVNFSLDDTTPSQGIIISVQFQVFDNKICYIIDNGYILVSVFEHQIYRMLGKNVKFKPKSVK